MDIEFFREYCLTKKGVTEEFPFDEKTLVFKVMGKIFALTDIDAVDFSINLKCEPEKAILLREQYKAVQPGYHMNKKHWNTIYAENISDNLLKQWIDDSYRLVVAGLPKKIQKELENFS
jgi:predicted DNA-binding protein (MmcQ/YjbR family)